MIVTASTTAAELVPQNKLRKSIVIQNVDGSDTVYIKRERNSGNTVTSSSYDVRIGPGAAFALNSLLDGTAAIQDRYTIVAGANTPQVAVFETEDQER